MRPEPIELIAACLFAAALIHTFAAKPFERLSHRFPRHAGVFHLFGEVEVVFGFWAMVLVIVMAFAQSAGEALAYAESRNYADPLFVFVVMVVAGSRPVLATVRQLINMMSQVIPLPRLVAITWLGLAVVPLMGSLVTEPAAMTIAALMLSPIAFTPQVPERAKYVVLGTLFVNVSIGGTLTSYAAPPVLMVVATWQWDSAYMLATFGWKAIIAVVINASVATWLLRKHLQADERVVLRQFADPVPWAVVAAHLTLLTGIVLFAHRPVAFLGLFLLFLGFARAYERHQDPLLIREALLVAFFLAGLVVLGGLQRWWLQPIISNLEPSALFVGALGLTAVTDNAALTYLGSLVQGMSEEAKVMLVAGAVAGGGLTVIANAPNPAGLALLKHGFSDGAIGAGGLLLGAIGPTVVAALLMLL